MRGAKELQAGEIDAGHLGKIHLQLAPSPQRRDQRLMEAEGMTDSHPSGDFEYLFPRHHGILHALKCKIVHMSVPFC